MITPFQVPADSRDPAYAAAILNAVTSGNYEMPFAEVHSTYKGHTGTFLMSADALKIDGVRWGVGAYLMQQIADALGCLFPTPRLRDLLYLQRNTSILPVLLWSFVKPPTWSVPAERGQSFSTSDMTLTESMRFISSKIDDAINKVGGPNGIIQTTGKPWVISNELLLHPGKADNYGWMFPGSSFGGQTWESSVTPPLRVIQGQGFAHDLQQADYAQTITLVHRRCVVDGRDMDLADVYQDPELSGLVSHEGPLKILRQPGVPVFACVAPIGVTVAANPNSDLCPTPPPPKNIEGKMSSINWGMVAITGALAVGVIGAFFFALHHAGRPLHLRRMHENPRLLQYQELRTCVVRDLDGVAYGYPRRYNKAVLMAKAAAQRERKTMVITCPDGRTSYVGFDVSMDS